MKTKLHGIAALATLALLSAPALAETINIARIDPFSGPAAGIVENANHTLRMVVDIANRDKWAGGNRLEVMNFDNKGSPQEALKQLKNATDQGIRYVLQSHSSAVGLALIEAVNRHNERNPGKEIIYLNLTNGAPEMTNEKCSFWQFRFDGHQDMKTQAFTNFNARQPGIKKVYLINQHYATGPQTSAGCEVFAREGATVFAIDIDQIRLNEVVSSVEKAGGKILGMFANLLDPAVCRQAVDDAAQRMVGVDILWNHAGMPAPRSPTCASAAVARWCLPPPRTAWSAPRSARFIRPPSSRWSAWASRWHCATPPKTSA
ncbi:MAG: SDR family NAD(P)-dependent oxidoreductase [Sulfuricaulis sp.]|nr:SDR family NAD(P)-dependent oxidoreductase [Sulfuricaulis sp.]